MQTNQIIDVSRFAAINQTQASSKTSDKYKFIPTTQALTVLAEYGWFPTTAMQARTRVIENQGFQKHALRLVNPEFNKQLGVNRVIPQLLLKNSHCGTSQFELSAAMHVFLCGNGMCVATDVLAAIKVRHIGYSDVQIGDAAQNLVLGLPGVMQRVEDFRQITLDRDEQKIFAEAAIEMRFDGDKYAIKADDMLRSYRSEEQAPTLWNTLNVVQEKVIKGGVRQFRTDGSRIRSRRVTNIDEDTKLNRALWSIAEKFAQLKTN